LCPELIGRAVEVDRLARPLEGLTTRRGGVVVVVGEAGEGKSRLVRHLTSSLDAVVLGGRAVPGRSPVAYRPLAEALLAAFRDRPLPSDPTLLGFEAHLGRLVPTWSAERSADDSPVLLGEAIARLLTILAADRPCVLVLEDIHWADPETVAVIEYLSDALRGEAVLCVCTTRPEGPAADLIERLGRESPDRVVRLDALGRSEIAQMVGACLGTTDPPAGLAEFVEAHSDGNPFLVEELLAGLVAADALRHSDGHWQVTGPLTPAVPADLRASIRRRLAELDPDARRVLGAAALLGRHFEWDILPGITGVDGRAVVDALRAAVDEQLIEVDGEGFTFRHALTREGVLADLLPPDRRDLAARAWPTIERANPGLPGPWCQLAADLAEAAGNRSAASVRLVEVARRALADGALATAENTARRARGLAEQDPDVAFDADEALVQVLVAAGKPADALALGRAVAERSASTEIDAGRRTDLLVALARAGVAAGDLEAAGGTIEQARRAAGADPVLLARVDAVAAEVVLDRADLVAAERLGQRAVRGAEATDQPEVLCEALLVLGRVTRPQDSELARGWFERAAEVAAAAGLARWHLRAQHELALEQWDVEGAAPMRETRELAARYGAHITVAVMDLGLADIALSDFDHDLCLQHAEACVEASRRYGLATEPVAHLWLAGAHALGADDEAMQAAIDASLDRDRDDPRILADLYGRVLTTRAFVRDELDALPGLLDEMIGHVRVAPPTTSVYPGRVLWALVHAVDDDPSDAAAVCGEFHEAVASLDLPFFDVCGGLVDAVALGRAGDVDLATARAEAAYDALTATPFGHGSTHSATLVVARAAIRDGWGDPVRWLRGAEAWFAAKGFDRLVRRSRALLGEAGAPVPRRGRGESEVPESLRALGVTSREMDVLKLVIDGRTNKEIAAALYLSPKTVERHLTSLFDRTGVRNRQDLAAMGVGHLA
jgi:DNA-binding CsgD family transcriptional regulator